MLQVLQYTQVVQQVGGHRLSPARRLEPWPARWGQRVDEGERLGQQCAIIEREHRKHAHRVLAPKCRSLLLAAILQQVDEFRCG
jgi:hypothetical protein